MANGLSHDLYYKMIDPKASVNKRVRISKTVLLIVAVLAALVAQQNPADILFLVSAAFSFAASGFFPALILGIFWKRTTNAGVSLGMLTGIFVTFYYMAINQPWLRELIFNIQKKHLSPTYGSGLIQYQQEFLASLLVSGNGPGFFGY